MILSRIVRDSAPFTSHSASADQCSFIAVEEEAVSVVQFVDAFGG